MFLVRFIYLQIKMDRYGSKMQNGCIYNESTMCCFLRFGRIISFIPTTCANNYQKMILKTISRSFLISLFNHIAITAKHLIDCLDSHGGLLK